MEPSVRRFHSGASGETRPAPELVFAFRDDHAQLSAHMAPSCAMMAGGSMLTETDARRGLGAAIGLTGRVPGMALSVDEVATQYQPPLRKAWRRAALGRLFGRMDASWCVTQMLRACQRRFPVPAGA